MFVNIVKRKLLCRIIVQKLGVIFNNVIWKGGLII